MHRQAFAQGATCFNIARLVIACLWFSTPKERGIYIPDCVNVKLNPGNDVHDNVGAKWSETRRRVIGGRWSLTDFKTRQSAGDETRRPGRVQTEWQTQTEGRGADQSEEAKQRQSNISRLSLSSAVQPQAVGLSLPT